MLSSSELTQSRTPSDWTRIGVFHKQNLPLVPHVPDRSPIYLTTEQDLLTDLAGSWRRLGQVRSGNPCD
jgi:hypothetical protein